MEQIQQPSPAQQDAFGRAVEAESRRFYPLAVFRLGGPNACTDAEDVLQSTLVSILGAAANKHLTLASFGKPDDCLYHEDALNLAEPWQQRLRVYILRTLTNKIAAFKSKKWPSSIEIDMPAPGPLPLEDLELLERIARLKASLDSLDDQAKEIVALRHFDELEWKEIAEISGVKISTLKSMYRRIIAKFPSF